MSAQTTLTENPPMILDATCSTKRIWPKEATIHMDVQAWVKPELVGDNLKLPFRTHIFDRIFCDPPHLINSKRFERPRFSASFASVNRKLYPHEHFLNAVGRFGNWLSRGEWMDYVIGTNEEFFRVLKSNGVLEYKLCEALSHGKGKTVRLTDLDLMTHFVQIKPPRVTISPFGKNKTYWLTMKPKPTSTPNDTERER